ncbi:MAG: hypothetical protein DCF25_16485 [Leptolyngbya foveolarum]|uniref:Uncharacterized protein n=1 Tax=Leptolyngbya foveolarum TaxID=47253 RepID=A0A2W4TVS4_9CYAN|nr:MAG: hypothetical protein DCF25_16485 [Leptolyngbya foveolarum]
MALTPDDIEAIAQRVAAITKQQNASDLDWSQIKLPIEARKVNQSGTLSAIDFARLSVSAKLLGKGLAAVMQTAVVTYLRRNREEHLKMLEFIAAREGISREETFMQIYNGTLKP